MLEELKSAARRASDGRQLRGLLLDCHRLLSERGEANSVAIARQLVARFSALPEEQQAGFFDKLSTDFSPDPQAVLSVAQAYAQEPTPENLIRLTRLAEPPRQELLRRINRTPGGTAQIVAMRRKLLSRLPAQPGLSALESDFHHLLSSWFNPGFLQMQQVDWRSPAELLEQIIRHEAVHEIDGWDDLRRRLQPDRRCFAFFHPQLPNEPLIFVEVALVPEMPQAIAPLIDKREQPLPPSDFKVAAFYSISNCQPGLRGVSLGNFLIKRVAEHLQRELPQIRRYCTLSPIPGFAKWLQSDPPLPAGLKRGVPERLTQARELLRKATGGDLSTLANASRLQALDEPAREALSRLCASYLVHHTTMPQGDSVARFHLDNGARLERLNPLGDLSRKGLKQSFGLMVNYLYDLDKIEASHEQFVHGEVAHSRAVSALI
jgi:malonyl-CoA decarboxylase